MVDALTNETCSEGFSEGFYAAFILSSLELLHEFKVQTKQTDRGVTIFDLWFREQQKPSLWERILGADTHIYFPSSAREVTSLFSFLLQLQRKEKQKRLRFCLLLKRVKVSRGQLHGTA